MKVVILGGGSIGEAFARCLLSRSVIAEPDLLVVEVNEERAARLREALECNVSSSSDQVSSFDYVLIAVKPQDFDALAAEIANRCRPAQVFISVMAGVPIQRISAALGGVNKIVRCMPNLPVIRGEGAIAYVIAKDINYDEQIRAERILASGGTTAKLDDERLLDPVTAISGSGPGYLFYALEKLIEVSAELGLSEETARSLVFNTMRGSLSMAEHEPHSLATLRAAVTSKGGTTAAAVDCFEEMGLERALKEGIRRACRRAKELAQG